MTNQFEIQFHQLTNQEGFKHGLLPYRGTLNYTQQQVTIPVLAVRQGIKGKYSI